MTPDRSASPVSVPAYTVDQAWNSLSSWWGGRWWSWWTTARRTAKDHSGPLVTELLTEAGFVVDGVVVVSADEVEIRNALNTAVIGGVDLVVSVGGTGVTRVTSRRRHPRHPWTASCWAFRGVARVGPVRGHHRRRPVPWARRHLGEHPGGQRRRLAICGPRRHGNPEPAGRADHRSAVQPGDLIAAGARLPAAPNRLGPLVLTRCELGNDEM